MSIATNPPSCSEMMRTIQSLCEQGAEITISKNAIAKGGKRMWSIRGATVDASFYPSMTEAYIQWIDAVKYCIETNRVKYTLKEDI